MALRTTEALDSLDMEHGNVFKVTGTKIGACDIRTTPSPRFDIKGPITIDLVQTHLNVNSELICSVFVKATGHVLPSISLNRISPHTVSIAD